MMGCEGRFEHEPVFIVQGDTSIGNLRWQSALSDSSHPVIIISDDDELMDLEVEEFYPDTTDGSGSSRLGGTFKIKVKRKELR